MLIVQVVPAGEFSVGITVQPDGTIDLPPAGPVKAEGMPGEHLAATLTAKFSESLSDPRIIVSVRQFSSALGTPQDLPTGGTAKAVPPRIAIIGSVKSTGYFSAREGMKLLDLMAQAGGTGGNSKAGKVKIYSASATPGQAAGKGHKGGSRRHMGGNMEKNIPGRRRYRLCARDEGQLEVDPVDSNRTLRKASGKATK